MIQLKMNVLALTGTKFGCGVEEGQFELYKTRHKFDGPTPTHSGLARNIATSDQTTTKDNHAGIHQNRRYKSR